MLRPAAGESAVTPGGDAESSSVSVTSVGALIGVGFLAVLFVILTLAMFRVKQVLLEIQHKFDNREYRLAFNTITVIVRLRYIDARDL